MYFLSCTHTASNTPIHLHRARHTVKRNRSEDDPTITESAKKQRQPPLTLKLMIILENGTHYTVEVKNNAWNYIQTRRVHVSFDGKVLHVRHEAVESGEMNAFVKQVKDMQNELERREADVNALRHHRDELEKSEPLNNDLADRLGRIGLTIAHHIQSIEELRNKHKVEVEFKKTTVTTKAVLRHMTLKKLPFFECAVIFLHPSLPCHHSHDIPRDQPPERKMETCTTVWLTGDAYLLGLGVKKDQEKAKHFYHLASEHDNNLYATAMVLLRGNEDQKEQGVERLKTVVERQETPLGEQGSEVRAANFMLSLSYLAGAGVHKDIKESAKYMQKAAEQGHVMAQLYAGLNHFNGRGVTRDQKQAAYWFRLAADQGQSEAQFHLGTCYKHGCGVMRDSNEAIRWFAKAAKQGHSNAEKEWIPKMADIVEELKRLDTM